MKIIALFLLVLASSCSFRPLEVQTLLVSHESLASFRVGTPDPRLSEPFAGQRLLVQWYLTQQEMKRGPLTLKLDIRFRNHTQQELSHLVSTRHGCFVYDLINEEFNEKGGILSYRIRMLSGECVLHEWTHPLFVEWISLDVH